MRPAAPVGASAWRSLLALLLPVAAACGGDQKNVSDDVSDVSDVSDSGAPLDSGGVGGGPSAYDPPESTVPAALPIERLAAGLDQAVAALLALDPAALHAAQRDAMGHPDGPCTGLFASVGLSTAWSNDCATRDGWAYDGRAQAAWLSDAVVDGVRMRQYGEFITTATYTHPGGAALRLDGRGDYRLIEDGADSTLEASLVGTFAYAPGAEPWLSLPAYEGAPSLSLAWRGEDRVGGDRWVALEGGLSGGDAASDGILGVRAEGLRVEGAGGDCRASGALVLLGAAGDRYRIALDGDCAACAPLIGPDGAAVGELCPALAPLLGGAERPW